MVSPLCNNGGSLVVNDIAADFFPGVSLLQLHHRLSGAECRANGEAALFIMSQAPGPPYPQRLDRQSWPTNWKSVLGTDSGDHCCCVFPQLGLAAKWCMHPCGLVCHDLLCLGLRSLESGELSCPSQSFCQHVHGVVAKIMIRRLHLPPMYDKLYALLVHHSFPCACDGGAI